MGENASEGFHRRAAAAAMVGMIIVGVVCVLCNIFLAGKHWPPKNEVPDRPFHLRLIGEET